MSAYAASPAATSTSNTTIQRPLVFARGPTAVGLTSSPRTWVPSTRVPMATPWAVPRSLPADTARSMVGVFAVDWYVISYWLVMERWRLSTSVDSCAGSRVPT